MTKNVANFNLTLAVPVISPPPPPEGGMHNGEVVGIKGILG